MTVTGNWLVGGLLLMPLLIAGIIIWWPRRRALRLGLLPKSSERGVLIRSHGNIGGIFALPICLLTLTGVILVYPVEARRLLLDPQEKAIISTSTLSDAPYRQFEDIVEVGQLPSWSDLIELADTVFLGSQIRSVRPASEKYPNRRVNVQQKEGWHRLGRSYIEVNRSGTLTTKDALSETKRMRIFNFSYPLHTAKLGLAYKLVLTMVGLAFGFLCVIGLWSFLQSKQS